ncbi:hypothetical protein PTTG_01230 [Puccinia triticina 1-1 BBBD Race 1]|uniref:Uncharacterized protein n=1 Tax=Puccinia triticina (isolate 1-1 / race 1 (BBBD)) TaxID=630390 RepID=A0A0C4EKF5_PUCT1|nr:hypothetical protein PTTG_01230 [Puccinia triticina 1-1 BBBD Race 1]
MADWPNHSCPTNLSPLKRLLILSTTHPLPTSAPAPKEDNSSFKDYIRTLARALHVTASQLEIVRATSSTRLDCLENTLELLLKRTAKNTKKSPTPRTPLADQTRQSFDSTTGPATPRPASPEYNCFSPQIVSALRRAMKTSCSADDIADALDALDQTTTTKTVLVSPGVTLPEANHPTTHGPPGYLPSPCNDGLPPPKTLPAYPKTSQPTHWFSTTPSTPPMCHPRTGTPSNISAPTPTANCSLRYTIEQGLVPVLPSNIVKALRSPLLMSRADPIMCKRTLRPILTHQSFRTPTPPISTCLQRSTCTHRSTSPQPRSARPTAALPHSPHPASLSSSAHASRCGDYFRGTRGAEDFSSFQPSRQQLLGCQDQLARLARGGIIKMFQDQGPRCHQLQGLSSVRTQALERRDFV